MSIYKHIKINNFAKIIISLFIICIGILILLDRFTISKNDNTQQTDEHVLRNILSIRQNVLKDSTPQIQMYYYIKQYSKEYNIPENIMFSIANIETGYKGPLHNSYKHNLSSNVAHGPMQITNSTAKMINGKSISTHELKNDIEKNVRLSAMLLSYLYKTYGDWDKAISAYNSGVPTNTSGSYVQNVKYNSHSNNIKNKWIK